MSKVRILLFLGLWVTFLSYLGFPSSWKNIIFSVSGLVIIYISYLLYNELKANTDKHPVFDNFLENTSFNEEDINQ
jgi:uncharacterized membrane protein